MEGGREGQEDGEGGREGVVKCKREKREGWTIYLPVLEASSVTSPVHYTKKENATVINIKAQKHPIISVHKSKKTKQEKSIATSIFSQKRL